MLIEVKVLDYTTGVYEGNAYSSLLVRYKDKILKLKIDAKSQVNVSKDDIDRNLVLSLEIFAGQNQTAVPKVVDVVRD